jgi:hypothetical protein
MKITSSGMLHRLPTFQRAIRAIIALMMDSASTSETSINFYPTTRRSIPEDSHLQLVRFFWQM